MPTHKRNTVWGKICHLNEYLAAQNLDSKELFQENQGTWRWNLEADGKYSVKSMRMAYDGCYLDIDSPDTVWCAPVPKKVNIFIWRARKFRQAIHQEKPYSQKCGWYYPPLPAMQHARGDWRTPFSQVLHYQSYYGQAKGVVERSSWSGQYWGHWVLVKPFQWAQGGQRYEVLIRAFMWVLWSLRNEVNFRGKVCIPTLVASDIRAFTTMWLKCRGNCNLLFRVPSLVCTLSSFSLVLLKSCCSKKKISNNS